MATPPTTVANMSGVFESVVKLANSRGYYILYALKGNIECETHSYTHTMTLTLTWSHHHHHQCFHHHRHHRWLSVCWAYTTYEQSSAQWRGINIKLMDTSLIYVHIYVSQIDKYCVGRRQREVGGEGGNFPKLMLWTIYFIYLFICRHTLPHLRARFVCFQFNLQ